MKWLDKLKEYAPSIATAVLSGGATLPQLALKAISDATGVDVVDSIQAAKAIDNASPDDMLKLKQADNSFKIKMVELGNELTYAELADVQQARIENKHSPMPAIICCALTLMVAAAGYCLFTINIPPENTEIAYLLFGALMAKWGDSIAYWVGTTRSSANKDFK